MATNDLPFPWFSDTTGLPLQGGSVYFGVAGQNPITNPVTVYWDSAATQPASQPVSCVNGAPSRNGVPTRIWVTGDYSRLVLDGQGRQVLYEASVSPLSGGTGASMIGFLQSGTGAVSRTAQDKMREVIDLTDFGAVDTTGVTEATAVFNLATAAAAAQNKGVRLPAGTLLLDAAVLPTTLPELIGRGKYTTKLKFKRYAYPAGKILLDASNNTAGIHLADFSIDCDSVEFKTAGIYALVLNASHNAQLDRVRVVGRGQSACYTSSMTQGRINFLTVDATGTAANSFHSGFEGQNCLDVKVFGMRTTGLPEYSGTFGAGTYFSGFYACHTEGTSGGFGYSLGGASYSHIMGCTSRNTSHEAYQLTNCYYCSIDGNTCEWETGFGVDSGISINGQAGTPGLTRFNKVVNNTIINSYACGLLCANNSQSNTFANNKLRDCGVRGHAAAAGGTKEVAIGQYTDIASVNCTGNSFRDNESVSESGSVKYHFGEFNSGAGSTITQTKLVNNRLEGTADTASDLIVDTTTSEVWDLAIRTATPTISPAAGAITSYTASMDYRRQGRMVDVPRLSVSISNAGTGSGALTVLWGGAPNAASNGGALSGREIGVSGKLIGGVANGGGVVMSLADGTTPIATGASIVVSGAYKL